MVSGGTCQGSIKVEVVGVQYPLLLLDDIPKAVLARVPIKHSYWRVKSVPRFRPPSEPVHEAVLKYKPKIYW